MSDATGMLIPKPSKIERLERMTPTVYEAAVRCVARASWVASSDHDRVPPQPQALLGIAAHAVFERAGSGGLPGDTVEERKEVAAGLFEDRVKSLWENTHPLVRAKFETHEHIPFFNIRRAGTAQQAATMHVAPKSDSKRPRVERARTLVESTLRSKDGRVSGRPDAINVKDKTVVDYKSGSDPQGNGSTEEEVRQLRLYAFLARENGIEITRGVIARASGNRAEVDIPPADAEAEGRRARETLVEYNQHAGEAFSEAATPSSKACRYCPCIPFCSTFWEAAKPEWQTDCGAHVEGTVESVEGDSLLSLHLNVARGSGPRGAVIVTRLSKGWVTLGQTDAPQEGEMVRVTDAAHEPETFSTGEVRADRDMTAVWRVQASEYEPRQERPQQPKPSADGPRIR